MCAYVFRFIRLPAGLCFRKCGTNFSTRIRFYDVIAKLIVLRIFFYFFSGRRSFFVLISTPSFFNSFSRQLTVSVDGTCIRSIEKFYNALSVICSNVGANFGVAANIFVWNFPVLSVDFFVASS